MYNISEDTCFQHFGQFFNCHILIKFCIHEVKKASTFGVSGLYLFNRYQKSKFYDWHLFVRIYREFYFFLQDAYDFPQL